MTLNWEDILEGVLRAMLMMVIVAIAGLVLLAICLTLLLAWLG